MLQSRGGTLNLVRLTSIYYFFTVKAKKQRGNFSLSIPIISTGVKNKTAAGFSDKHYQGSVRQKMQAEEVL